MKLILKAVLMNIAVLLVISSCATITEGPEGPSFSLGRQHISSGRGNISNRGELRLLSVDVPQSGNLSSNVEY